MSWTETYNPNIWPLLLMAVFLLFLAGYSWRQRSMPGALPFMVGCLFSTLTIVGQIMMTFEAANAALLTFWMGFQSAWALPSATAITIFVLEYAWPGRWLKRRSLVLFSILPLLFIAYFLVGDGARTELLTAQAGQASLDALGAAGQVMAAYLLVTTLVNLGVFAWLYLRSPQHRWPVVLMAIAALYIAAIYITGFSFGIALSPASGDIRSYFYILPFLIYAIALFGFNILDPVALASQTALDQLSTGLFVLDPQGKVVKANLLAEEILGLPAGQSKGQDFAQILPASLQQALGQLPPAENQVIELSLATERDYTLAVSPLKDWRGWQVGRLLLLRDVTEPKRAREKQQQEHLLLAVLEERERLARELHDSLGQVLGYASFQLSAAAKLSRDGKGPIAADQLDRLGEAVRTAHADLREHILNLRSTAALTQPFFPVVQQYLEAFSVSYSILTDLEVDPALAESSFAPEIQLQLFRILQEALSNARKHGAARRVEISFSLLSSQLRMSIQDDGSGFDPQQTTLTKEPHYGLQFMRERAAQLKGRLEVQSAPGAGTRVVLELPLKEWTP